MHQVFSNKLNFLIIISVFLLFFFKSVVFLDPDFGWHIKMGELILTSGISKTDTLSYTMISFPFVDHAWLTNAILYLLYQNVGYAGLAAVFSITSLFSILIMFKVKQKFYFVVPFVLSAGAIFPLLGIRPQLITWLFFSILITIFFDKKIYKKSRFLLPVFFLIWANLHGGFAIGIFLLLLFSFFKIRQDKKISFLDFLIIALSVLATLVNPYGIHIWREVYMTMSAPSLRWSISEWKPAIFVFNISMWTLFSLSGILLIRFRKSFGLFEKTLYLGLLIAGLSSVRHMAFWVLISIPVLSKCLILLSEEANKFKFGKERFKKAHAFLILLSILAVVLPIVSSKHGFLLTEGRFYPSKAVDYLKMYPGKGNIFSEYSWGGYLIWKYPGKKVFIDGRMSFWRWDANIKNESNYAFKEYSDLLRGKMQFKKVADKYNVDTVLLSSQKKKEKSTLDILFERINNKFTKKGKYGDIYSQLKKEGWKIIYKDGISVIYRKSG